MNDLDAHVLYAAEVRAIQNLYPEEHRKLKNWGLWSRDRVGIFPPQIAPPPIFDQWDGSSEGYAEELPEGFTPHGEVKAEKAESEPYSEKEAITLDERIHAIFPWKVRKCLVVAYVTLETPESQFPALSKVSHGEFLQILSGALEAIRE